MNFQLLNVLNVLTKIDALNLEITYFIPLHFLPLSTSPSSLPPLLSPPTFTTLPLSTPGFYFSLPPPPPPSLSLSLSLSPPPPTKKRFIPVPVVGSAALTARMKQQEQECKQQQSRLEVREGRGAWVGNERCEKGGRGEWGMGREGGGKPG